LIVLDVIRELTADTAIRAQRFDTLVGYRERRFARRHQRTGRTRLHTLAAGDARRGAHRVIHVEHDLGVLAAEGETDHIVDLLVAAGAQAAGALDARIEIHCDRRVAQVGRDLRPRRETGLADTQTGGPVIDLVVARVVLLGHVGLQQLDHHFLRLAGARTV